MGDDVVNDAVEIFVDEGTLRHDVASTEILVKEWFDWK